jgi:hypothetical protein
MDFGLNSRKSANFDPGSPVLGPISVNFSQCRCGTFRFLETELRSKIRTKYPRSGLFLINFGLFSGN